MPKATPDHTASRRDRLIAAAPNVVRLPVARPLALKPVEQMSKIELLRELAMTWGLPAATVGGMPGAGSAL